MSDIIERIKQRIEARKWKITDDAFVPELIGMQYANNMNDWCLEIIDEELAKEPQVPQWIPCSERLPETEVNVLIYQIYKETNPFAKITIGHLHQESDLRRKPYWKYIGYGQDMFHPKIESYHRADFICPGCEYVIAWQPLPQPYTENRKEL